MTIVIAHHKTLQLEGYFGQYASVHLSGYNLGSGFEIRFKTKANHKYDRIFVDDLEIAGS